MSDVNALSRFRLAGLFLLLSFGLITIRLFYWQILSGPKLEALGLLQYQRQVRIEPIRGQILASDGYPLVANQTQYQLHLYKPSLDRPAAEVVPLLASKLIDPTFAATASAETINAEISASAAHLTELLNSPDPWIPLKRRLSDSDKARLETLNLPGLGFDVNRVRHYPESSLAAQLLGFVGQNEAGYPQGYFGLEGFYHRDLTGEAGVQSDQTDAFGRPILFGAFKKIESQDGRTLETHLDRGLQLLIERHLIQGLTRYQAVSGEVIVMDPHTGGILGLASFPNYHPARFIDADPSLYHLPSISETYEPGSTFKTLVMAAAVNEGLITPDTVCAEACSGPVTIGQYQIRTWNNQYQPGQTVRDILERSDNVGMVMISKLLGQAKLTAYLEQFGIGQPTQIDLQRETVVPLRSQWAEIDTATVSFGQGIAVTSMQMLSAVGSLANQGVRLQPQVVRRIINPDGTDVFMSPQILNRPVSPETAAVITDLMVTAANHGEAQWAIPKGYRIAGKTGTAQIPIAGHYDANKTIASFIGFAPAEAPRFVMLVKLKEPGRSPWASETAAPLWVAIAKDLFTYFHLPPTLEP